MAFKGLLQINKSIKLSWFKINSAKKKNFFKNFSNNSSNKSHSHRKEQMNKENYRYSSTYLSAHRKLHD